MPLNIKNPHVERLAAEIATLTGETKTEAIRRALDERRARLAFQVAADDRAARIRRFLEDFWRELPAGSRRRRLSRKQEEAILGYGPDGV